MAGRFSTTVSPKHAKSLYQNTSNSVQVASINLLSSDSSKNPKINLKLDTSNPATYNLNAVVPSGTPVTSLGSAIIDIGTVGSSLLTADVLARYSGQKTDKGSYDTGSGPVGAPRWKRCTCIDPYMWIDPADYFSYSTATVPFIDWSGNGLQVWLDAKDKWASFKSRWAGLENDTSRDTTFSSSYANSDHPSVFDFYSGTWIGVNGSNYMYMHKMYYNQSTFTTSGHTQSSSSIMYALFSSNNQSSNYGANGKLPLETLMQSDRGVFVFTKGSTVDNDSTFYISQVKYNTGDQIPITASFFEPLSGACAYQNALISSSTSNSREFVGGKVEWIKYNPATSKYYFYIRHSSYSGAYDGIYSATSESLGEPAGGQQFWTTGTFTKEAEIPEGLTYMYQPSRVAKSLWISADLEGTEYYSTDLLTWKNAEDYFNSIFDYIDNSSSLYKGYYSYNSIEYFKNTTTGTINKFDSDFDSIPSAGSLENQTPVGTFERTGVLLNPGDYIYLENEDTTATISSTVMYVEV